MIELSELTAQARRATEELLEACLLYTSVAQPQAMNPFFERKAR